MPENDDKISPSKKGLPELNTSTIKSSEHPAIQKFKEKVNAPNSDLKSIIKAINKFSEEFEISYDKNPPKKGKDRMNEQEINMNDNDYFIQKSYQLLELFIHKNHMRITESEVKEIDEYLQSKFEKIFNDMEKVKDSKPEKIVSEALSSLSGLDKESFLLNNLLESLKRGDKYIDILERFNDLGITDIQVPEEVEEPENKGKGSGIISALRSIKNISSALSQILVNSLKAIPSLAKLKPRVAISATMIPAISFEIEEQSVTFQKLFELLTKSL